MAEIRSDVRWSDDRSVPGSEPLTRALTGPYQPFILDGDRSGQAPRAGVELAGYRLWFVREGQHEVRNDAGTFRCRAGEGLLLLPGTRMQVQAVGRSAWRQIDFDVCHRPRHSPYMCRMIPNDMRPLQPLPRAVWGVDLPSRIPAELAQDCGQAMETMTATWWRSQLDRLEANTVLAGFLVRLVRTVSGAHTAANDPIERAETWAREHLDARPTVAGMARAAGLSRPYLTEQYHRRRGRTPRDFLDDLRMQYACKLLLSSDMNLTEVARQAGYGNPVAFGRRFRLRFGRTPSAWRSRSRPPV